MIQMEALNNEKKKLIENSKMVNDDKIKMEKNLVENQAKKVETLKRAFITVNKHLSTYFPMLLPQSKVKLE